MKEGIDPVLLTDKCGLMRLKRLNKVKRQMSPNMIILDIIMDMDAAELLF